MADNYLALITGLGLFGGTGSAIVLRPGLAVTSAHVLRRHDRLTVLSSHGAVPVRLAGCSTRMDLAVLAVPLEIGRPIEIAAPQPGQPAWSMGTTTGGLAPTAAGRIETADAEVVVDSERDSPLQEGLMYAADAGPGYSGGPVVDATGRLIGMTEGIYTRMFGARPEDWPALPRMFAYRAADVAAEAEAVAAGRI